MANSEDLGCMLYFKHVGVTPAASVTTGSRRKNNIAPRNYHLHPRLVVILMGLKVIEHGTFRFSLKSTFLPSGWADWNAPRFYAAYFFLADFTRAHLALCAAAILRLPAAEIVRLG